MMHSEAKNTPADLAPVNTGAQNVFVEDGIDLRELLGTLLEAKWLIAAVMAACAMAGAMYALLATPIYSGDALLQVESGSQGVKGLEEFTSFNTGETPAEAEIEIIRSRSIIGTAVDQLHLDIDARPRYFPVIGEAITRYSHKAGGVAEPWLGLDRYAWGGERIAVQRLLVPADQEAKPLTLIAGKNGAFQLLGPDDEPLIEGARGQTAAAGGVEIFVTELTARPGTEFRLIKQRRTKTVATLQKALNVTEKGKKTGVLQLTLEGPRADIVTQTLDTISNLYLRQNVERRSAEAAKTLGFLQTQLPQVKANLDAAEANLNAYQSGHGSIDLPLETQSLLQKLAEVEKSLSEIDIKRKELAQKFTESHPSLVTLDRQRLQFETEREELNKQIKAMPQEVQESVRLTRDVKVADEVYLLLLQKSQEMNVVKAGTIGNVRILDKAQAGDTPVKPKKALVLALSLVLGVLLGAGLVFALKKLRRGVEDPDQLEQHTGLPVYATVPHSERQMNLAKKPRKGEKSGHLLAAEDGGDMTVESLRSLRTSLQFALMDARNNIVVISGPSPGIGKSFVAANLAFLLADAGKRVLLVDGDMRKGHLHDYFDIGSQSKNAAGSAAPDTRQDNGARENTDSIPANKRFGLFSNIASRRPDAFQHVTECGPGLSGAISGAITLDEAIHSTGMARLDFIPRGVTPPNPSELLMSERFQKLLQQLSERYDLVIFDTPPVLAVTDAAIAARLAGISFLVVRHGLHPLRELEETIRRFHRAGVKPKGFVLNNIPKAARAYGYGKYEKYGYHYQNESAK